MIRNHRMPSMEVHIYGDQEAMFGGIQLVFDGALTPQDLYDFHAWYERNLHYGKNIHQIWADAETSHVLHVELGEIK